MELVLQAMVDSNINKKFSFNGAVVKMHIFLNEKFPYIINTKLICECILINNIGFKY